MPITDLIEVTNANNRFANNCFKILSKKTKGNIFFSPLSAHTVLSMVYQGAFAETAECFAETLGLSSKELAANGYNKLLNILKDVHKVTLYAANKIYVKEGFPLKSKFQNATAELFLSETEGINFENSKDAAESINYWIEDKTNGKIKNIIIPDDLDCFTRLILLNAICFKGNWDQRFLMQSTRTEPFFVTSNDKIDCQMMHITKFFNYREDEHLDARILEMMYVDDNTSMVVILPNKTDGIDDLENKIVDVDLSAITQDVRNTRVELSLPKFRIETCVDLESLLGEMGLQIIFDKRRANFSEISKSDEELYVSKIIQKAFIEVNEDGTEAAAVTQVKVRRLMCGWDEAKPVPFIVDHPFVTLLQIKTEDYRNTLFYVKVVNPCY